jgi:hypothetical protein
MIVLIAQPDDVGAHGLVERWSAAETVVLRPEDLSRPGWIHRPDRPGSGRAVVDGHKVATSDIDAVLSRRACILPSDLEWLAGEDRDYSATEMTAFLVAWLSSLPCPVVNRPQPNCLCGPNWSPTRWRAAAARSGMELAPAGTGPAGYASVVGAYVIGAPDADLAVAARRLATGAGVELVSVGFTAGAAAFTNASLWPDLTDEAVVVALERLLGIAQVAGTLVAAG